MILQGGLTMNNSKKDTRIPDSIEPPIRVQRRQKTKDNLLESFRKNLRNFRKENGYTQQELADMLKLNRSIITAYESGKAFPKLPILIELADIFFVTVDDLIGYPEEELAPKAATLKQLAEETGLDYRAIHTLSFDKYEKRITAEELEALSFLINYNRKTDNNVSFLKCLYEALKNPSLSAGDVMKYYIDQQKYYNNPKYFLSKALLDGEHISLGEVYLLMTCRKINYMVKERYWGNTRKKFVKKLPKTYD